MKKIITFGASNSRNSINQQFAIWSATQLENVEAITLDLNNYEMPIYSIDREAESGIPKKAQDFKDILKEADAIILSLAEHNGSYSAAFKNIMDWISRIEKGTWANKPILLLATSPGPRGGQGVLAAATGAFPHQGAQVVGSFSLPSFGQNFNPNDGITNPDLLSAFQEQLNHLNSTLAE